MEESIKTVIKEVWEFTKGSLSEKLGKLQARLERWASTIRRKRESSKRKLTKELDRLAEKERDDETLAQIIDTKIHLNLEIDKDELYWEQRARANWLQFRDRNTAYFHKSNDVVDFCLGILNNNKEVASLNNTDIVLIPKLLKPTKLANFRPISLCTVIYKIVAKTLANRLQEVIGKCVEKVQSAFVPGRLLSDNVILAYEILHTFRKKRTGKKRAYGSEAGHE
ncbi:hypothetical protein PVK06_037835 [Gossypium arboreum]|uniref:Reverse transcriptase n=1 Tax=Gossypium arboreum TaxID=29729 RepID=A0ABR0N0I0_GOSAR|nr:hypothetical protein PVK06_037835 [Gossypium arboreum]